MFLKRRTRTKAGKSHTYYSVCESLRVSRDRVVQRQVLHLGELNTTQLDSWQHSIDVLHEDDQRRQLRLFTDLNVSAPNALLDTDAPVVDQDRLYRCLDRLLATQTRARTTSGRAVEGPLRRDLRSAAL